MNNSKLAIDSVALNLEKKEDITPKLTEREATLTRILEAIREVQESRGWSSLKKEVFDGLVERLERDIRHEARKDSPDPLKLRYLTGQLYWAEKYSDLSKLELSFREELKGVRLHYGTRE